MCYCLGPETQEAAELLGYHEPLQDYVGREGTLVSISERQGSCMVAFDKGGYRLLVTGEIEPVELPIRSAWSKLPGLVKKLLGR